MTTQTIRGIGAAAGITIGPVFRYETREQNIEERHIEDSAAEQARLDAALAQAKTEILCLCRRSLERKKIRSSAGLAWQSRKNRALIQRDGLSFERL